MEKKGFVWVYDELAVHQVEPNLWTWSVAGRNWFYQEGSPGTLLFEAGGKREEAIAAGTINEAVLYTLGHRDGAQCMCAAISGACQEIAEKVGSLGPLEKEEGE